MYYIPRLASGSVNRDFKTPQNGIYHPVLVKLKKIKGKEEIFLFLNRKNRKEEDDMRGRITHWKRRSDTTQKNELADKRRKVIGNKIRNCIDYILN